MYTRPTDILFEGTAVPLTQPGASHQAHGFLILPLLGPGESAVDAYADLRVSYRYFSPPSQGGSPAGSPRDVRVPGPAMVRIGPLTQNTSAAQNVLLTGGKVGTVYRVWILESPADLIDPEDIYMTGLMPGAGGMLATPEVLKLNPQPVAPFLANNGASILGATGIRLLVSADEGKLLLGIGSMLAYQSDPTGLIWAREPGSDLPFVAGVSARRLYFPDQVIAVGAGRLAYRPSGPEIADGSDEITLSYEVQF